MSEMPLNFRKKKLSFGAISGIGYKVLSLKALEKNTNHLSRGLRIHQCLFLLIHPTHSFMTTAPLNKG